MILYDVFKISEVLENFDLYHKNSFSQEKLFIDKNSLILAKKIKDNECFINWSDDSSKTVFNKYRAFYGNVILNFLFLKV